MKRILTATAALGFAAALPAAAHDHSTEEGEDTAEMAPAQEEMTEADAYVADEITVLKAFQVFLVIDDENDGVVTKSEWSDWQRRTESEAIRFDEHDLDGDGDLEFSEYWAAVK